MAGKYDYLIIIQQHWGQGWEDVDSYEADSSFYLKPDERAAFKENLRLYRTEQSVPVRVIHRRELKNIMQ